MNIIKKEIVIFESESVLMNISNSERLILDSFAIMYIVLKKLGNINSKKYQVLNKFFENLNIVPQIDKEGNVFYREKDQKGKEEKEDQQFFKRKNNSEYGEKKLINDILFNFENEIDELIYTLNKV